MPSRRKPPPASDLAARVRHLIAVDAANVMQRVTRRQDEMVALFSRLRDRGPMLGTLHSWFESISFQEMAALAPHEQRAVNRFYDLLDELRWYARYTEDMPGTVQQVLALHIRRLGGEHRLLIAVVGPPSESGGPIVESGAETARPTRRRGLASGERTRR